GIAWAQPATPEAMGYMRSLLPAGSPWFAFGISLHQFPMAAQAGLLGGAPRGGPVENLFSRKGQVAPGQARPVGEGPQTRLDIVATPTDARAILGLKAVTH